MRRIEVLIKDQNHGVGFNTDPDGTVSLTTVAYGPSKLINIPLSTAEGLSLISAAEAAFMSPKRPDEDWLTKLLNYIRGR